MPKTFRSSISMIAAALAGAVLPTSTALLASTPTEPPPTTTAASTTTTNAPTTSEPPATESPSTVPPATEGPTTEPATTEPATSEPATTAPAPTEPNATDVPPTEPVSSEPATTEAGVIEPQVADPPGSVVASVTKDNSLDGQPVEPGDDYTYQFVLTCTSIEEDCVNYTFADQFPSDVIVDESTLPQAIPGVREVTWVPYPDQILTVTYLQPLDNPPGNGLQSGSVQTFDITVTVPEDTDLESGDVIVNDADATADNADPGHDESNVTVTVPRVVTPVTSKSWSDPSAIAGSGEQSTITLGATNASSTSAEVTSLGVGDLTPGTWEVLNFTGATVTAYPTGADTAQLYVCTQADSCPGGVGLVPAGSATTPPPDTLDLPAGVDPDDVTGVEVVFSNADGDPIPRAPQGGGQVQIGTELRDTYRSSGVELQPTDTLTIDNCASVGASDTEVGPVDGADACAPYQIIPSTLIITPGKSFFPDTDGDGIEEAGEYAVIGEDSPVTGKVTATNDSPFPISEVVITEPNAIAPAGEFAKFDADTTTLVLPDGATNAHLTVTYEDGTVTDADYTTNQTIPLDGSSSRVTSITVTYTGVDGDGNPTIAPGSTAGLNVHGTLNDGVTEDDLATGASPGVDNCAGVTGDAGRSDGTGTFTGSACDTLVPQIPRDSTSGTKTATQDEVAPGGQLLFRLTTTNNGNRPLPGVLVSDPAVDPGTGTPTSPSVFDQADFLLTDIQPATIASRVDVFLYVDNAWTPIESVDPADYPDVSGVQARVDGNLLPAESFVLRIGVQFHDDLPEGATISNCFTTDADSAELLPSEPWCSPDIAVGPAQEGATLNKSISPPQLPRLVPGLERQEATVTLRVANSGNQLQSYLQVTDEDEDATNDPPFWDAVDFVRFGTITGPAAGLLRADLIQVDAFVNGAWANGTPTSTGSPVLPAGVQPIDVRGLRFTFTRSLPLNNGFVITPCAEPACAGVIDFVVSPRETLVSDPATPVPDQLVNTADGAFLTQNDDPDDPPQIPPTDATLELVEGDHQIDVDKTPNNTTLAPGELREFDLATTNNGTALIPDLTVVEDVPEGLVFDDTFVGDNGDPYVAVATDLPAGYDPLPTPTFDYVQDSQGRITQVRWTFAGWNMPVGATVRVTIRMSLQPGILAGETVINHIGATSPVDDLACTQPDVVVTDGDYGAGTYCTDPAQATATAGAAFVARKWVAGNPDLGWYSPRVGAVVPVGGGNCPSFSALGRTYTSTPCIALVNPGDQYHYLLRIQNAGTESATRMVIIDAFPAPGDTGVLGGGRGTQWANRPTLAGPADYFGPTTGTIGYTSGSPCTADLQLGGPGCPAGAWAEPPSAATTAFRLSAQFDTPLPPGGQVFVGFDMDTPLEVPRVDDPTVAWNSLAHAEATQTGSGGERILPPIEPIKVGVATMYGRLEVIKAIGDNPADLPVGDLTYQFAYDCVASNGTTTSASGTVTATPTAPGEVIDIPAGSTCSVWETDSHGGVASATEADPTVVSVAPYLASAPTISTVTITNDFPIGRFEVTKAVTGGADPAFTDGPFLVSVDCSWEGQPLPGFPLQLELDPGETDGADVPVGATCRAVEIDAAGAVDVTYDPPAAQGDGGLATVPADGDQTATQTITNTYAVGSLVIEKSVRGAGVPQFSQGPFVFDVTCDYLDEGDVFSSTVTVAGSADGTPVRSDPVDGLPLGAVCTVTEIDDAGGDSTAGPVTVAIEANDQANVTVVGIDNPFSAATVAVAKTVDGDAANSPYVAELTYPIHVECAVAGDGGGEPVSVYSGDVTVAGDGVAVTATDDAGAPALLPVDARCWAEELRSGGASAVSIGHDSFADGVAVEASPDALQTLVIDVTNTFDPAVLVVSKAVVNGTDPDAAYIFDVTCAIADIDGSTIVAPLLTGTTPFTLSDGETASFDVLANSTCTVTETGSDGATVTISESGSNDDDPGDGVVTVRSSATVALTNTFDSGVGPGEETTTTVVLPRTN